MNLPFIDKIWRVKGSLPIDPPQSAKEAFDNLNPLFRTKGTDHAVEGDTLMYSNKNPAAQDRMATFTRGTLRVEQSAGGSKLTYDLSSPALLFCFLAPLLFLAFAQFSIYISLLDTPADDAREASAKEDKEEDTELPLHWIDKALGAPQPEIPGAKDKTDSESKDGRNGEKEEKPPKHSPTSAYVFAAIFATLYLVGRFLEPWLVRRTFRRLLAGIPLDFNAESADGDEAQPST